MSQPYLLNRGMILAVSMAITGCLGDCVSVTPYDIQEFDVSPDGSHFVVSSRGGELYLLWPESARVVRLTRTTAHETLPSFSATGDAIAFASRERGKSASSIYVRKLPDGPVSRVTRDLGVSDMAPSFSADGSKIVFCRAQRLREGKLGGAGWSDWDIYTVNSDGSGLHRITTEEYYEVSKPRFGHGGQTIIYSANARVGGLGPKITSIAYTVDADGAGSPRVLTPIQVAEYSGGAWASGATPAPAGEGIAFVSDRVEAFAYDILLLDGPDAVPTSLGATEISSYNLRPVFSADGQTLYFLSEALETFNKESILSLWQVDIPSKMKKELAPSDALVPE